MKKSTTNQSKKFIATLPYLVVPSDDAIDQMEIKFHLNEELGSRFREFDFEGFGEDNRFLYWWMEIEDARFERVTDDYHCMKMQSQYRPLAHRVTAYLDSMNWADSEALLQKVSATKKAIYECMFIEIFYATGERKYYDYLPKSVEGYLAMTSIDDRRALYASLGIAGYSQYSNYPYDGDCGDMHSEDPDRQEELFSVNDPIYPEDAWRTAQEDIQDNKIYLENLKFCPEQELVREIPLRGLSSPVRTLLIREYCVI